MNKQETSKRVNALIEELSAKHGVPKRVVEEIISFQFRELRKAFSELKTVRLMGFGAFALIPSRLKRRAEELEIKIDGDDNKE